MSRLPQSHPSLIMTLIMGRRYIPCSPWASLRLSGELLGHLPPVTMSQGMWLSVSQMNTLLLPARTTARAAGHHLSSLLQTLFGKGLRRRPKPERRSSKAETRSEEGLKEGTEIHLKLHANYKVPCAWLYTCLMWLH